MRKLFVHLSILCLLAVLLVPMVGCKKEEPVEESPAATTMEDTGTATDTTMGTDMGTTMEPMGSDMGGTTEPMGTEMTPPAQ
jgi:hypothetical protein